jgi:predicted ester cyclase
MQSPLEASNQRAVEEAVRRWNGGDLAAYLQVYSADVTIHGYAGLEPGFDNVRRFYEAWWAAFPGSQLVMKDLMTQGDRVACRLLVEGEHRGEFNGILPTGRPISVSAFTILRFAGGRCFERWSLSDSLALLAQIGAFPASPR